MLSGELNITERKKWRCSLEYIFAILVIILLYQIEIQAIFF